MRIAQRIVMGLLLAVAGSGCGGDDNSGRGNSVTPTGTSTLTATVAVATHTLVPTASATPVATSTSTVVLATATLTLSSTATATATQTPIVAAVAEFSASALDRQNPFPSDRLVDANGHLQITAQTLTPDLPVQFQQARQYISRSAAQLSTLSGFSTFAPLRVSFSALPLVDAGLFPRGLFLLQYDDLAAAPWPIRASVYPPDRSIEIQPVLPLKSKTTYALVVSKAIADEHGLPVEASPTFKQVLEGANLSPELAAWRAKLQPVIDYLPALDLGIDDVVLINLFTTQATTDDLVAIQGRLVSGELVPGLPNFATSPFPGLEVGVFAEGSSQFRSIVGDSTSPMIQTVGAGTFESYDFRVSSFGAFDPDVIYGGETPRKAPIEFYVTVPKAPKPAAGYPIALFGHGLGGSAADAVQIAKTPGDLPFMNVGISALQHGRRGSITNFFILNNIFVTREYFRQTIADMMQLTRMIRVAHDAGIAPFDQADPDNILYRGVSLGGIMGTLYMAVEPEARVGMLSVPGGGLPNIIASHDIGQLLNPLVSVNTGIPIEDPAFPQILHVFQLMAQWALDAADPINYAPHMFAPGGQLPRVPPKRVLVHEGIVDNTIPNRTTDDLALAMRLPDLNLTRGCADSEGCRGIWRYVMTDYGQPELSGHAVTFTVDQAQAQMQEFLRSFGTLVIDAEP